MCAAKQFATQPIILPVQFTPPPTGLRVTLGLHQHDWKGSVSSNIALCQWHSGRWDARRSYAFGRPLAHRHGPIVWRSV